MNQNPSDSRELIADLSRAQSSDSHRRKRGAQPGNQNARKHGFYSKVLGEARMQEFRQAAEVKGLDEEIALLRVEIRSLVEQDPPNRRLIAQDIKILAALVSARYNMSKDEKDDLVEKLKNFFARNELLLPRLANSRGQNK